MRPLRLSAYTASSALGHGVAAQAQSLLQARSGLKPSDFESSTLACWLGEVAGLEQPLRGELAAWDCRNNRLAEIGLQQDGFLDAVAAARARHGAARIGVFVGTSTSGINDTERAYRQRADAEAPLPDWFDLRRTQNTYSIADFVRVRLQLGGPCAAISTACSSSAKVFASAERMIAAGYCDAAVVGGVDSLCLTTLYGFNSLQLLSKDVCRPADAQRRGLSIGEAAGFALLEKFAADAAAQGPRLLGHGESSDAYHMSAPDPSGAGAASAMRTALHRAGLEASAVDYINLHGTGTQANDAAEDQAVVSVFGTRTPCSSTKGWTGHTLGAAGILEAVLSLICLEQGLVPRSLNTRERDPALRAAIVMESRHAPLRAVLSNSFGFGGNNCSLVFGA